MENGRKGGGVEKGMGGIDTLKSVNTNYHKRMVAIPSQNNYGNNK